MEHLAGVITFRGPDTGEKSKSTTDILDARKIFPFRCFLPHFLPPLPDIQISILSGHTCADRYDSRLHNLSRDNPHPFPDQLLSLSFSLAGQTRPSINQIIFLRVNERTNFVYSLEKKRGVIETFVWLEFAFNRENKNNCVMKYWLLVIERKW